jgi:DNA-binding CsgD family transcriptional regulator
MNPIGRIIDKLYDGALDSSAWPAAFTSLCDLLGADHAIGMVRDETAAHFPFVGSARIDKPHVARFVDAAPGGMAMLQDFPERRAFDFFSVMPQTQFLRSDFFNDVIRPMGGYRALLAVPFRQAGFDSFLAICRREHAPEFSEADTRTIENIVPHVTRALRIKLKLDGAEMRVAAALAAFDQIDAGVAIVDRELRPVALNRRLEQIVLRQDGLRLSRKRLAATDPTAIPAVEAMLWRAGSDDARIAGAYTMLLRRPAGRPPWSLTVRRLDRQLALPESGLFALLVEDLAHETGSVEPVLIAAFGLTRREAKLAAALARGDRLADAATALGITYGTARVYLKGIFLKTRTRRQAELVSVILRLTRFSV